MVKALVFLLCLAPTAYLAWGLLYDGLGPNPIEYITRDTGDWTLRFLLISLLITPARRILAKPALIKYRRMLGLFAFYYAFLHFLTYIWLDRFFDVADTLKDIAKRPFITVGFASFVLLIPLAITSTAGWIRRLGGKRWALLHRAVYISVILGVIHYWWLVKSDIRLPLMYAVFAAILLGYRLYVSFRPARP
ncbi:protein-methionine-sulfoxide reductase heme-binding subunit MsrQ [Bryobacterales bacterium F-183]|nr:protein-methionine-sulfoxide reductase heme-binding subunit MsrQ [Bryobacterales bacterium F-183]